MRKNKVLEMIRLWLASAGFLGLLPVAPGSFGALAGVGMHLAVVTFTPLQWHTRGVLLCLITVSLIHFMLTPWAVARWQDSDPGNFVLDEVAGYLVVPLLFRAEPLWFSVLVGFVLFRVFDIIKIPPARQIDRQMQGAWGILLDDIVSGMYAAGVLWLLIRWFF